MDDIQLHQEEIYRQHNPKEAKVGDVLMPHGWERVYANEWRKKVGNLVGRVLYLRNGIKGNGNLSLLGEAYALLKDAGILTPIPKEEAQRND